MKVIGAVTIGKLIEAHYEKMNISSSLMLNLSLMRITK